MDQTWRGPPDPNQRACLGAACPITEVLPRSWSLGKGQNCAAVRVHRLWSHPLPPNLTPRRRHPPLHGAPRLPATRAFLVLPRVLEVPELSLEAMPRASVEKTRGAASPCESHSLASFSSPQCFYKANLLMKGASEAQANGRCCIDLPSKGRVTASSPLKAPDLAARISHPQPQFWAKPQPSVTAGERDLGQGQPHQLPAYGQPSPDGGAMRRDPQGCCRW